MHNVPVVLLSGDPACNPSNKNFIGFKIKKKKQQLSVKNTLRCLGKSHVKIAKIFFYFYLFATNSYKLFGLSKKKKQKQKKI